MYASNKNQVYKILSVESSKHEAIVTLKVVFIIEQVESK